MKKIISLLLSVLFVVVLTACNSNGDLDSSNDDKTIKQEEIVNNDDEIAEQETTVNKDNQKTKQEENANQTGYVDINLEAREEVEELLARYADSRAVFSSSNHNTGDAHLLYGIINAPFSVNYSNYPVTAPRELSQSETESVLNRLGYVLDELNSGTLIELDKTSVYWIANNIFNISNKDIDSMIKDCIDPNNDKVLEYDEIIAENGKYYLDKGNYGEVGRCVDITWSRNRENKTFVKYDVCAYCDWGGTFGELQEYGFGIENLETKYAKMERKEIDGKKYWTVYEISGENPDDIFKTSEKQIPANFAGEYDDTANGYAGIKIDKNGNCNAFYSRESFSAGEGVYNRSECSVIFNDISKTDKYSFTAKIKKMNYEKPIGTKESNDGIKSEYVKMPYFDEGETVHFYLKGTPITKILGDQANVYFSFADSQTVLEENIVVFEDSKLVFYK